MISALSSAIKASISFFMSKAARKTNIDQNVDNIYI